jgi:cytochrome c556
MSVIAPAILRCYLPARLAESLRGRSHPGEVMKSVFRLLAICAGVLIAAPVSAQFAKPEDAVKYRQSAFALIGNHMGRINGQLKASTPNVAAIQSSAALVETMSKLPFEAFVPGSEDVGNTKVLPAAFKDGAKVKELADKMIAEVAKLNAAAKVGDVKAIQTQFGTVGQACKACHDDYRAK